jgi:hypothetical protein
MKWWRGFRLRRWQWQVEIPAATHGWEALAEFPALPLFTDAYLGDTTHLSTFEHGAYLLLLIVSWRTPGCCVADDDALLLDTPE